MSQDHQGGAAQLSTFQFEQLTVRTVYENGQAWFVGKDVAEALGYKDTINAVKQHCRGVVKHHPIVDSLGRTQDARIISEPDMFRLVVNSHLPAAERFERWVFEDVLPTLRKTGTYTMPGKTNQPTISNQVQSWKLIDRLKLETDKGLRRLYYKQLEEVLADQGLETPPLSSIGSDEPEEPPAVKLIWDAIWSLEEYGVQLNHSRDSTLIAINPNFLMAAAKERKVKLPNKRELMDALRATRAPRFIDIRVVNSVITRNSVRCWVFDRSSMA